MNSFHTLLRRTAAALGAIAALTATGVATAQTVQLKTGSVVTSECPYSAMSVSPTGAVVVTCSGAASAGSFVLTAPTSLSTNTTNTGSQVKVTRSGGTAGASDVAFTASGASCNPVTTSPLQFADAVPGSQSIELTTTATSGNCVVTLTSATVGTIASPVSRTIKVTDPDADVAFAFASPTSTATVGGGAVTITVTRTGGINGTWSVPYSLAGTLAASAADTLPANGELSGTLTFTGATGSVPGNQTATLTYSPPIAAVTTPANLIISFGAPTGGIGGTPPQAATIGAPHELTLNSAPVGCPVPETTANSLGGPGSPITLVMPTGMIKTYTLPTPVSPKTTGAFKLSGGSNSYPMTPWYYEVHINKCKGQVQETVGDSCYGKFANAAAVFTKVWFTKTIGAYDTVLKIQKAGYCYAPPSEGPWYVNIRYTYAGCTSGPACGWAAQWTNWSY